MKKINKLSIVIPVFNEVKTIEKIVDKVFKVDLGKIKKEIIVVNDGSTDGTLNVLKELKKNTKLELSVI
jgi:glycosyltransferase involved in cell wall biosynthesis